jgi:lysyl-tRNA synthetase, class II
MSGEDELFDARIAKVKALRVAGIDPYPHSFSRTSWIAEAQHLEGADGDKLITMAGRVMARRGHGRLAFFDIQDGSGQIQLLISKGTVGSSLFTLLDLIDTGDFIGAEGRLIRTKAGELSVAVEDFKLLTKTLRPLPDKFHGIRDPELKYRRRSEFLLVNPPARKVFERRAAAIATVSSLLSEERFLSVEIPVLQPVFGGAAAKPFITHVNALDRDYYLSISPELYLKRLVAAGYERVFTICKNFRNEGIDRTHNPEFTMMECYQAYADYMDMLALTERIYARVFETVLGTTRVSYGDVEAGREPVELDFSPPWERVTMVDMVRRHTGLDVDAMSESELRERLVDGAVPELFFEKHVPRNKIDNWSWGELVQELFECFAEGQIVQPTFVMDHPRESTPLCKVHRRDPRLIERFEPIVCGFEIGNAYSELNDPIVQRQLLEEQVREAGTNEELPPEVDDDFVRAIELGIPPTGGLGLGIDRMVMLLTGTDSIKDVILFPFVRSISKES